MAATFPRSVLITGGSSGIGEALARSYAADGAALAISGRDEARLGAVAGACRDLGATVDPRVLDVLDRTAMADWIAETDGRTPLDLVIANAGIARPNTGGDPAGEEDRTRQVLDVNITGVVNAVMPALTAMRRRRRGQIAIVSSIAGYRGMPGAPAYAASKAAVKVWGEGLRPRCREDGIRVSVICPGFVVSRMTEDNAFPMPFLMNAERAARIIRRGLARDKGRIAFPLPMAFAAWLGGAVPPAITDWMISRLPRKE